MVAGLILAAGESRRMGSPKPLLRLGEGTFLGQLLAAFLASRARPVLVVLGHEAERIQREVDLSTARVVINRDYRDGMLSSLRSGLTALSSEKGMSDIEGILVCPVDHPTVSPEVIDLLIERYETSRKPLVVPVHGERRGHPVLFARALFAELETAPDTVGARKVVWDHADEVLEVPTDGGGVLDDIDTPEDYMKLVHGSGRANSD